MSGKREIRESGLAELVEPGGHGLESGLDYPVLTVAS